MALLGPLAALAICSGGARATPMPARPAPIAAVATPLPRLHVGLPRLHVGLTFSYRVVGGRTRIRGISVSGLPFTAQIFVGCLGSRCFRRHLHDNVFSWARGVRFIRRHTYYAGQRLVFIFRAPGFSASTFVLRMRYDNDPKLSVYRPKRHHSDHLASSSR